MLPKPSRRPRLDQALVDRQICESREKAKRAILAGQVRVNGQPAGKPGDLIHATDALELVAKDPYVSRGGHKLAGALDAFQLTVTGLVAVDLGASTGGFTDCLLQRGVVKVYAVDVGQGQLAWKLRQDPRVVVMEQVNARTLTPAQFPQPFQPVELAVIDCSFISLRQILPAALALVRPHGKIVALIKPQFEAGKTEVDRGAGVITDPLVHQRVLQEIEGFVGERPELAWLGVVESPLLGPAGNKEFFAHLEKIT